MMSNELEVFLVQLRAILLDELNIINFNSYYASNINILEKNLLVDIMMLHLMR